MNFFGHYVVAERTLRGENADVPGTWRAWPKEARHGLKAGPPPEVREHGPKAGKANKDPQGNHRAEAAFFLGAMLPDFLTMAGCRLTSIQGDDPTSNALRAGVAHHHATDDIFHRSAPFVRMSPALTQWVQRQGVRRGPAMAVGHIGIELLLDRSLLPVTDGTPYLAALALGDELVQRMRLSGRRRSQTTDDAAGDAAQAAERLAGLISRLHGYGLSGYEDTAVLTQRLERTLRGRKRLAITPQEQPSIDAGLRAFDEPVAAESTSWIDTLTSTVLTMAPPGNSAAMKETAL